MTRRMIKPDDYETNQDYAYDAGFEIDEDTVLYDCSACKKGSHDECQRLGIVLCKCFLDDHEEAW